MILTDQKQELYRQALIELKSRFKRVRATHIKGREFWAVPNFQETVFSAHQALDWIDLGGGYVVLYKKYRPFIETGEYIVTYQIGLKNDLTTT